MFKQVLLLCFALFFVGCSSDEPVIEKKESSPDDNDDTPELIEETDGNDKVSFIEFPLSEEKVKVNLNMVPILNDYIEASASPQKDIHNMKLERVEHTDKKLYILSFSCHEDLCSYIILDRSGDNQAILLADIASLKKMSPSPDDTKLLLRFERETTLPLPLSDIVVIDTENWEKLEPENITDNTDPLEYSWPLLDADWSDDENIRVSKPDIDKPTEKGIKKWKETEQPEKEIILRTHPAR